ncbi:MAG: hypothetical protein ACRD0L_07760, partial [Acidimicrobiales bacterium]
MTGTGAGQPEGGGPEGRSFWDQALDVLVYGPVGVAVTAAEDLPQMVDKGRQLVTTRVALAKIMGQLALAQGQRQAERMVRDTLGRLGAAPPGPAGPAPAPQAGAAPPAP